jgi:diguanylate cyclase (GGDEF)-like protein
VSARSKSAGSNATCDDEEITGNVPARAAPEARADFLIILSGGQMGQLFPVREGTLVIGRGDGCDVRIDDDGVSRRQAQVHRGDGAIAIRDLDSRNGTFVNGQRIAGDAPLCDGDRIQFGNGTVIKLARLDKFEADYQRRMFEAAVKDALTGIYNRRHFQERLEVEVAFARRHSTPLSLILLDLDHFKQVNDSRGHVVADKLLQALARRLRQCMRTEDLLARFGGDEFVVLSRIDTAGASTLAERIRGAIAGQDYAISGGELRVSASLGVASLSDAATPSGEGLIECADRALHVAKRAGRNCVRTPSRGEEPREQ